MSNSNFTLTVQPLKRLNARSVSLASLDRTERKQRVCGSQTISICRADVIVLANGFEATPLLASAECVWAPWASHSRLLGQCGDAQAYMGTAIDGFPNFFMMVGPNTSVDHSPVILGIGSTVEYILKLISPVLDGDALAVESKKEAALRWTAGIP
ncbi:hypothetical protein GJ744_003245 [Endocarpon pusillum]|uniref:Uncharacterized protein n=1 Tax=Endocarpon pusillum TaxID=364733 RepID=A0A8H7A9C3_9EURO|nr:hypothetical protein GJ744_003245 [Endocarpon pusillum]